ncbi:MAG TPA: PBP1A family penicillin-binding protein [Bosea sp. (in: a-proteobacteria)]|jgi:penicillin-binding protein 1A|uniref:transglycosylase domain-containing protein n=1 Tax=Bosea sp. (in: a-proteobacteria) TaxID=1871050 RepID=UPI002DDD7F24|nr:PBP1A family penicillin-binding protein [Bosea sp. (in: a-proteobacteria)]HEV2552921.1 PBP1A family penicillin-binding protein [Bosea sp. (in: a-proteobacteria)]
MNDRTKRAERREPSFEPGRGESRDDFDMRLSDDDRPSRGHRSPPRSEARQPARRDKRGSGGGGRRRGRRGRSFLGGLFYWTLVLGLWCAIGLGGLVAYHAAQLPPINQLTVPKRPPNIAILAADGSLLANRGETGGRTVTIGEVPPYLPKAFVAIEDRRFYEHFGIDPIGLTRAMVNNLRRTGGVQGGSTLTQQLAKNLFLTQERTAARKIQEAILALWLERTYSKDQILELYLNRVYFGSGAYGVEAAAQRYFNKSARSVTIAEAAMLAGLVQAPSRLAPNRNPEAAEKRAQLVIAAMADQGLISQNAAKTALVAPAEAAERIGAGSVNYAADYVMDVLDDFIGAVDGDVTVLTTIDTKLQSSAETILVEALTAQGAKQGVSQGAVVSMANDGGIRALIGGRDYTRSQFNRATAAKRQPGSAFKPFVYLAALEKGLTPDTIRDDSPVSFKGWEPENYSRSYRGPVTLQTALAHSLNTIAARLISEVTPKEVIRTAQRLGINSALQPNLSLALGTSEVTPVELTAAYATFANGGQSVLPYVIREVKSSAGKVIYARKAASFGPVIQPQPLSMMNAMLHQVMVSGTGAKANIPGWEVGGKSGTTQDFRDAWFVGYTARLVTAVWLGNDDNSAMKRVAGSGLPAEIWGKYMKAAHAGLQPAPLPGGLWQGTPRSIFDGGAPVASTRPPANTQTADSDRAWVPPAPQEKNFLERLFGG